LALIQATLAEMLGITAVSPDDDFFELGGHSLMAASVATRLGERLGLDLPSYALFAAPTPAEMAELVAELGRKATDSPTDGLTPFFPDWVVPLQREGARRPVFVFPAGHDETVALGIEARIAAHTGRDHPFWGLRRDDPGLDRARADGVPGMATAYITQMRIIQGSGPYLLYANCAGAPYAWEVARQLLGDGEAVAGVLLFEAPLWSESLRMVPGVTPAQISSPAPTARDYLPRPLPVDLTLLMTKFWWEQGWSAAWEQVALGKVETVVIPGETEKAFVDRDARIARHVREWIEQAEARIRTA
jgi:acyl carrier protein